MLNLHSITINTDEDISPFIRGKIHIIQKKKGYRFNVDSLLLVNFVNISPFKRVIDLGTGSGIIPILLNLKLKDIELYAVEVQQQMYDIAKRNFVLNKVDVNLFLSDVKDVKMLFSSGFFDVVITNPPYFKEANLSIERSEILATFEDFVKAASFLLKNKGKFFYIYPVGRFIESLSICKKYKLQPKRFRFIHPSLDEKATHLLVECLKSGKEGGEIVERPLIMYKDPKKKLYTEEVWCILENFPMC